MQDLIVGMMAMAAYRAMNKSHTKIKVLPRSVEEAAWKVFNPWWSSFTEEEIRARNV